MNNKVCADNQQTMGAFVEHLSGGIMKCTGFTEILERISTTKK
jgi:hypothetical protein